ncbi:stage II sporulation protein D [Brevibacillus sp. SYSU BS000544]|uniref:stage II sporulation protein D n=1 Tax=Brevibacillus sp. SYSU BS000544 TaxID=3416443 RepID=UPI003CE58A7D
MKRHIVFLLVVLPLLLVIVPASLVYYYSPVATPPVTRLPDSTVTPASQQVMVKVYRTATKKIESIPLETYIEGVVSAEMPAEFEMEALKAQALAARTYIVRRLREGSFGDAPKGAQVEDTVKHQAYLDDAERKKRWGTLYEWKKQRIVQAVKETSGMVLTYNGEPIDATFFSTSNGFTENAEEYWEKSIPYLKSVASPWDRESPRFEEQKSIQLDEFEQKLGIQLDQTVSSNGRWFTIVERTTGNRIGKIRIGAKEFSGREIRERLGLNSTSFTMQRQGNTIWITMRGYGHGVGMSQWGANGMAKSGKNAEQIVKYFYQGVTLQNYQKMLRG